MAKAYEIPGLRISLESAVALDRYVAVKIDANGKATLPEASKMIAGVTMENVKKDAVVGVVTTGVVFGRAAEKLAAGDVLTIDAAGKFKKYTAATDVLAGMCVVGADQGAICSVLLK